MPPNNGATANRRYAGQLDDFMKFDCQGCIRVSRSAAAADLDVRPLMNTRFRHLVVLVCFVATVTYADSQGYIVPNGITYSSAGSMAVIDVLQNPTNGDFARFILKPEFKRVGDVYDTIFPYRPVLGESVRTFLASPNDPISLPSIEAGSYSELSMGSYYGFDLDVPFYLGVYTGYTNGVSAGLYNDPVFGWAEFVNHQGMIQLLDSALVMEGGGIYVGTQTIIPVPEPGELSLFVVGVFMLGYWAKSIKSLQATRDDASSSASRFTLVGPACLDVSPRRTVVAV